jgi:sugar phosphate isomerase/epimerase
MQGVQLSLSTVNFSPRFGAGVSLIDALDAAAAAQFTAIGLDVWSVRQYVRGGGSLADLPALLTDRELTCTDVVVVPIRPDRDATISAAHRATDIGTITGAHVIAAGIVSAPGIVLNRELRTLIRECVGIVFGAGMRVALEYIPGSVVDTVSIACDLCSEIGWEGAGLLADSWQTLISEQLEELSKVTPEAIAMVQFGDAILPLRRDLLDEMCNHRRLPGQGNLDLRGFVDVVRSLGYDGFISAEILSASARQQAPTRFAEDLHQSLTEYWATPCRQ